MNFTDALVYMTKNESVIGIRRSGWVKPDFLFLKKNSSFLKNLDRENVKLTVEEYKASDWEIVQTRGVVYGS